MGQQDGWVAGAILDVVQRAHGAEGVKPFGGRHGAKFLNVGRSVFGGFHAQEVGTADIDDSCGKKIRALGDGAADENATGAAALNREFGGGGEFVSDEVF